MESASCDLSLLGKENESQEHSKSFPQLRPVSQFIHQRCLGKCVTLVAVTGRVCELVDSGDCFMMYMCVRSSSAMLNLYNKKSSVFSFYWIFIFNSQTFETHLRQKEL